MLQEQDITRLTFPSKSQLASEYCHHIWKPAWDPQSSNIWVLWAHANSSARLEESVQDLAEKIGIHRHNDRDANIFQLFHAWLSDPSRRWLLVLDNMDELEVLFGGPHSGEAEPNEGCHRAAKRPVDYFSVPSHGHVKLTTRYKRAASRFIDEGDGGSSIKIGPMKEYQAVALLRKRVENYSRKDLQDIATDLGYVPLALVQAAAYMQQKPCSAE